jgi:hypothetical protein
MFAVVIIHFFTSAKPISPAKGKASSLAGYSQLADDAGIND